MSGHSKWHSIRHKKSAEDARRGKIFTKHAKLIAIAARNGSDPDANPGLRTAIDNAKAENVPNSNIDRAIKKGSGEDKNAAQMSEVSYEGYGPNGVAIYIKTITDNNNRTLTNVRTIMNKNGGNLGDSGCTAYLFEPKGHFIVNPGEKDPEELQLELIDFGAEDIEIEDGKLDILCDPGNFVSLKEKLDGVGLKVETSEQTYIPSNTVDIDDESTAKKVLNLIEKLEEDDDVSDVYANFDIPEEILEKLE